MIKILEVNPNSNDAMSLYRGRLPLIRLQKKYRNEIEFHPNSRGGEVHTEWDYLNIFDMVFIMRPTGKHMVDVVDACNLFNIPVWVDFDDLLTDIPLDNPAHSPNRQSKINEDIDRILDGCTFATFSTEYLMKTMGKNILHKSHVVPNALDLELFRKPCMIGTSKKILWRGSHTHDRDLSEFQIPIRDIVRKSQQENSGWMMEFMGMNPMYITDYVDAYYTPYMNKSSYFSYLSKINGKINIVPLSHRDKEIDFNKSKSNISWLETLYGGMISLAPDWDEWKKPGIINYTSKQDFGEKLIAMMNGEFNLEKLRQESWQYIRENLTLEKTNEIRYELINQYLKPQLHLVTELPALQFRKAIPHYRT